MLIKSPQFGGLWRPFLLLLCFLGLAGRSTVTAGTWAALAHTAPDSVEHMLLLSDGTVLAANNPSDIFGSTGNKWYRLTPDNFGSYRNGTWTTVAAMNDTRLFYSSAVLRDGRLFVAGGEYGSGRGTAEIYDPIANTWTYINPPLSLLNPSVHSPVLADTGPGGNQGFIDSGCIMIANGNVLVAPVGPNTFGGTLIYNPVANSWSAGPTTASVYQDEASWVKLPDGSVLTIDPFGVNTERYIPASNTWISDANVPLVLYDSFGLELGPAFLLPNGKAIFFGANGHTAIYTPSGTTANGTWVTGPDFPNGQGMPDAPGAMMVNGKILLATSATPTSGNHFPTPTSFYEYDYTVGSVGGFTQVGSPVGGLTDNVASYQSSMLDLPDGTVLYCHIEQGNIGYSGFGSQLYVYTPSGSPLAAGKPTISSITRNGDGSYHLTGTKLNGISGGAAYGDDVQMDSNYPLVRLTDGSGNVTYARTYNWSSTGVQTGNTIVSTEFSGTTIFPGNYNLQVVANGIASDPVFFQGQAWLDFTYAGFLEFGSFPLPFKTLAHAVAGVQNGGTITIKTSANSTEIMTINKPMTINAIAGPATIGVGH